jgi:serine/threonine protein kinase
LLISEFFEHYKVTTSHLGSGAFSTVKMGVRKVRKYYPHQQCAHFSQKSGDMVAIKTINLETVGRGFDIQRVNAELAILREIDHPYIIKSVLSVFITVPLM